jgi:hypothetical protein
MCYNSAPLCCLYFQHTTYWFNPLNAELNPICHLLALLGAQPILHVSWIRVKIHIYKVFMSEESNICTSTQLKKSLCNNIFFMGVHYFGHPARNRHHVNIIVHCSYITSPFTSEFGENFTIFMGNWKQGASPKSQHLTLWQSRAFNKHTYHLLQWSAILWLLSLSLFILGKFL